MRCTVVTHVSTALEMLRFSTDSVFKNAGTTDFDYLVVTWLPSPEVTAYLETCGYPLKVVEYKTDDRVGYVPNIRGMMNLGYHAAFELNDYAVHINTDICCGYWWLYGLVKFAGEDVIVNSTHLTPIKGKHCITCNFGVPEYGEFDQEAFDRMYRQVIGEGYQTEDERGGWLACATMPTIFHRKWWEACGPWALNCTKGQHPPDRACYSRMHDAGAEFILSNESVVYHHEAVERKRNGPPPGAEHLDRKAK